MSAATRRRASLLLPAALCVAGFAILQAAGHSTLLAVLGGVLLFAALLAAIGAIILRLGPQSRPDREREARAREIFEASGRWPEEEDDRA